MLDRLKLLSLAAIVATLVWLAFTQLPFLARAEQWLHDYRTVAFANPQPVHKRIVILAIGERTLQSLPYRSPVDRGFLADLIEALNQAGVTAIGLDVLVDQPTEPDKDQALIEAIRNSRAPVTLAWVDETQQQNFMTEPQRQFLNEFKKRSGAGVGLVNLVGLESGGTVRQANLGAVKSDAGTPGFAVALAQSVGSDWVPEDPTIVFRIPPTNGDSPFPVYELRPELLTVFPPKQWLEDKIVLVGAVRPYEDRHRTPLVAALGPRLGTVSGVVLHAHVLAQLLDRRSADVSAPVLGWLLTLLMTVAGVVIAIRKTGFRPAILLAASVLLSYWGIAIAGPRLGIAAIPTLAPGFAFLITSLATGTWIGQRERRRRRFLKQAFSRYVSPAVVESVCREPDRLALGGERRELSFVFTDVEGFTTLSESLEPELLGELFNDYLNQIVALIFEHGGTLEKFVGDAVMTMFGAPLEQSDHACRALAFALAVDRWSRQFESAQRERGIAFGRTRIGVNSGVATVGNFGGTLQFSYTAHGDAVNTAARLETLNKHLGTRICVGERTGRLCNESRLRPVGQLVLKGKTEALQVLEPIVNDERGRAPLEMYMSAYQSLASNDPVAAVEFETLRRRFPQDPLVRYHCERLLANQEGVRIVMESK